MSDKKRFDEIQLERAIQSVGRFLRAALSEIERGEIEGAKVDIGCAIQTLAEAERHSGKLIKLIPKEE